jgi:hypothetical protein
MPSQFCAGANEIGAGTVDARGRRLPGRHVERCAKGRSDIAMDQADAGGRRNRSISANVHVPGDIFDELTRVRHRDDLHSCRETGWQ